MEIKREFLYEEQSAFVILTDDPQKAEEYAKQGVCCIGISREDAFFEGTSFVANSTEDVDEHFMQLAWCRYHHIPLVIFRAHNLMCRESMFSDYDALYSLTEGEESIHFPSRDVFRAYIENAYDFWGYGIWTILVKKTDNWEVVGWIGINQLQEEDEIGDKLVKYYLGDTLSEAVGELGFVIRKDLRGQGIAKEICTRIIEYASEYLGMASLIIQTEKDNEAARALALSLGFK